MSSDGDSTTLTDRSPFDEGDEGGEGGAGNDDEELLVFLPNELDPEALFEDIPEEEEEDEERIDSEEVDENVEYLGPLSREFEGDLDGEIDEELALGEDGMRQLLTLPRAYTFTAFGTVALLGLLFVIGIGYYLRPLSLRPAHALHDALRPSGPLGLGLGIAGTLLMVASLGYLVRKRTVGNKRVPAIGPLRAWMSFHIFGGLIGPAFILFHAALVPTSAIGMLAFFGMAIVTCSGVLGRYIYIYFPRSLEGRELKFDDIRKRLMLYRRKLLKLGVSPSVLRIEDNIEEARGLFWFVPAIGRIFHGDRDTRREFVRLKRAISSQETACDQSERLLLMVRRLCREHQWLVRYNEFRMLMGTWRHLHRWLAIVMFIAVVYHVAVNVRFGRIF